MSVCVSAPAENRVMAVRWSGAGVSILLFISSHLIPTICDDSSSGVMGEDYAVGPICGEPQTIGKKCSATLVCQKDKGESKGKCVRIEKEKPDEDNEMADDDGEGGDGGDGGGDGDYSGNGVLLMGGVTPLVNMVETWPCSKRKVPALPSPTLHGAAAKLGTVTYVCGGTGGRGGDAGCLILNKGSWKMGPSMMAPRYMFTMNTVGDKIVAIGGLQGAANPGDLSTVQILIKNMWTQAPFPLPVFRHSHCAATLSKREVAILGGIGVNRVPTNLAQVLDIKTGMVRFLPPLVMPRYGHSCIFYKKEIIVAGGRTQDTYLNAVEAFNMKAMIWRPLPMLMMARLYHTMAVINGKPTVFGGLGPNMANSTTEVLTTANKIQISWVVRPLKIPRYAHSMVLYNC